MRGVRLPHLLLRICQCSCSVLLLAFVVRWLYILWVGCQLVRLLLLPLGWNGSLLYRLLSCVERLVSCVCLQHAVLLWLWRGAAKLPRGHLGGLGGMLCTLMLNSCLLWLRGRCDGGLWYSKGRGENWSRGLSHSIACLVVNLVFGLAFLRVLQGLLLCILLFRQPKLRRLLLWRLLW